MDHSPFLVTREQRVALYIDGPNLHAAFKTGTFDVDYKKLLAHFEVGDERGPFCRLIRANYFTAINDVASEYSTVKPLVDWLSANGYVVHTKPIREVLSGDGTRKQVRASVAPDLAAMLMRDAFAKNIDHAIIFSGDVDMLPAVREAQAYGVRVTCMTSKPSMSVDLRGQVDRFLDLHDKDGVFENLIGKPPNTPASRRQA
jgi:uncharacterized LabA/DUF88 family protein